MANESWKNPWKLTAIGMALVIATVLVTGFVVANWSGRESDKKVVDVSPGRAAPRVVTSPAAPTAAGVPTQSAIDTCNQSATAQAGQREKGQPAYWTLVQWSGGIVSPRIRNHGAQVASSRYGTDDDKRDPTSLIARV